MNNKFLISFFRVVVGLLFIFSGLIKANDPLGFGYKLEEYFEVFHITFLNDLATTIAISLCAAEIILGAALLAGIRSKQVIWGLLAMIVFFTFLTFYSAAFDVVKNCGCFGDAIPLTPWQSFFKDLVLLLMIAVLFAKSNEIKAIFQTKKVQTTVLLIITLLAFGFGIYTYNYLPIIDFLPYKIGANLPEGMRIPAGAVLDDYEITYQLKNKTTAEEKEMTDKEYLKTEIWKDESWEIIGEPVNKLLKKGFEPKIKDLKISDSQGTDYTTELIENPYYNLVIVAYKLDDVNTKAIADLNALAINAVQNYNIRTVLFTSTSAEDVEKFNEDYKLAMEVFYADAVPLKSMVRANPGILLLKNGTVINKWHFHLRPTYDELEKKYFQRQ
jgi:uncharacterized membrane protein YphA (DoxX/SURF4 family)